VFFVIRNVRKTRAAVVPIIVTSKGALFMVLGIIRVGAIKINFEKNQPERIVPIDRRIRAPFRFESSSFIGEKENTFGLERKHKTTMRNL